MTSSLPQISTSAEPQELLSEFQNPGAQWRGKPFWSWNGQLSQDELIRQIHILKEMGMGGFFMHSRTGLITEYLGEQWFELINVCADEAEKLGLEAWLYDEDRWPSGTAGGLVTRNPQFRSKFVRLETRKGAEFLWSDEIIAAFSCELDELSYRDCQRIDAQTAPATYQDKTILVFTIEEAEPSSFYNGFTYVDTMQRAATDEFIQLTHERYKESCGARLGTSIKGIFVDEPHRGPVMNGFSISNDGKLWMAPWTPKLFEEFKARFGTDLIDALPELFLEPEGKSVSPIKWQYMELTQQLFLENFAQPLYDWCEENKIQLTGHVLHEDTLTAQATMQGSLMRYYEFMQLPGIDVLSFGNYNYWIAKQLSSAARQLGQKWLLSELYGCAGWERTFEDHKAMGDWQTLFGINVRCQHLSWFTMEGEAKRDFPASIAHQSAWSQDYHHVETYFARLGLLSSQGQPCCDLLVLNPIESLSCQIHAGWAKRLTPTSDAVKALETAYQELFTWLAGAHLDFDYGDEEMMSRLAAVETGEDGAPLLRVGQALYRAVVVGQMTTMRGSTLQLLEEFARSGGQVIFAGDAPQYMNSLLSSAPRELAAKATGTPWNRESVVEACAPLVRNWVKILDAQTLEPLSEVFCQLRSETRSEGETRTLVALNTNPKIGFESALIQLEGDAGFVTKWNCLTGERFAVPATTRNGFIEFLAHFPAAGEAVFVIESQNSDSDLPVEASVLLPHQEVSAPVFLEGPFAFELDEPNVCVLDLARFQVDDNEWSPETEVLKIDQQVRGSFGFALRSGEMIQPWFRNKFDPAEKSVLGTLRLAFDFEIGEMPASPLTLAIERPEQARITLNGVPVASDSEGWWVDLAFQTLALPTEALQIGANVLQVETDFSDAHNIEAVYLLGEFGVAIEGTRKTLGVLAPTLSATDLAAQGLPFYGGKLTLQIPLPTLETPLGAGETVLLRAPQFAAACLKVSSEAQGERLIAWQPYQVDVSEEFLANAATLDLEIVLTRRNTFGPLHLVPAIARSYGPGSFTTKGDSFANEYQFLPAGLQRALEIHRF